jgi:exodeoxyribonuclease VII large subunit
LDNTGERLKRAMNLRIVQMSEKMASLATHLNSLSPLNVLTRGYSLTHKVSGELVRAAAEVKPGDLLLTRVADGEIASRVEESRGLPSTEPKPDSEPHRATYN